ncbi:MAG: hypothetical protein ACREP9_00530 [Candidatus Dormibacteraceae bacterium]
MSPAKEKLYRLVEVLSDEEAIKLADLALQWATKHDPLALAIAQAPEVDEPLSPEDLQALGEGRRAVREGRSEPMEEVFKQLLGQQ